MVYDSVCRSVCNDLGLSVMTMSPAKMAEPTDTWTRVGPVNYTVSQKKGATLTIAITLSFVGGFAKFFHCCKGR